MFKQARDQYMSCMDLKRLEEIGLDPLINLLEGFGGWPVMKQDWDEDSFNWYSISNVVFFNDITIIANAGKN